MNGEIVSKGYGPNKRDAKAVAATSLLKIICPNIYREWQEKLKTHTFHINPNCEEKINREIRDSQLHADNDHEMVVDKDNRDTANSNEKENSRPTMASSVPQFTETSDKLTLAYGLAEKQDLVKMYMEEQNARLLESQNNF
jgi:hypothetical protein